MRHKSSLYHHSLAPSSFWVSQLAASARVGAVSASLSMETARLLTLLRHTPSPALVVTMAAVRHNIARMLALCGGDAARWRPHLKTTKLPPVWRALLDAGVTRFKVATPRELEHLGRLAAARGGGGGGRLDVLVALSLIHI